MKKINYYSQFGEDRILSEIFQNTTHGICVEVGANDGINDSTTYFFEKLGWQCVLVEPNSELCGKIRKIRNAYLCECAASDQTGTAILYIAEGAERAHGLSTISKNIETHERIKKHGFNVRPVSVKTRTLDDILIDAKITKKIDFVSIDVEGHELEVLRGFSIKKWLPRIILIEDNSDFRDKAVKKYLKRIGYINFKRTGVNDWYASRQNKTLVNFINRFIYYCTEIKAKIKYCIGFFKA